MLKTTPDEVLRIVSEERGIEVELMTGSSIERRVTLARNIAMMLMRDTMPMTFSAVAEVFDCTPSAVAKACSRVKETAKTNGTLRKQISEIKKRLEAEDNGEEGSTTEGEGESEDE